MRPSSPTPIIAQLVRHLPAMWETWVQFLGWEAPLGKEMATHSSVVAWRTLRTEEPGRLQSTGRKSWIRLRAIFLSFLSCSRHPSLGLPHASTGMAKLLKQQ